MPHRERPGPSQVTVGVEALVPGAEGNVPAAGEISLVRSPREWASRSAIEATSGGRHEETRVDQEDYASPLAPPQCLS
jgi:hypothetical protein